MRHNPFSFNITSTTFSLVQVRIALQCGTCTSTSCPCSFCAGTHVLTDPAHCISGTPVYSLTYIEVTLMESLSNSVCFLHREDFLHFFPYLHVVNMNIILCPLGSVQRSDSAISIALSLPLHSGATHASCHTHCQLMCSPSVFLVPFDPVSPLKLMWSHQPSKPLRSSSQP